MDSTSDRFDIDLGAQERQNREPQRQAIAERRGSRTLTELLAIAAADRAGAPLP